MKNYYILSIILLLTSIVFSQKITPKESKIEKVTVFLAGASIERSSVIAVIPGENLLLFNNLSPDIDESSIQISGLGNATITAINFNVDYLEQKQVSEDYKNLELKMDAILLEKNTLENLLNGFQEELALLKKNQRINSDATDLSLEKVKEMSSYYRKRTTEIGQEIYAINLEINTKAKEIENHRLELSKLESSKKEARGEVAIKLNALKTESLQLKIKYNITTAGWFPSYDIRAKEVGKPLAVSYKANVFQQSGSDWENVLVVLSTGDPNTNNVKPILPTKYLNFTNRNYTTNYPVRSSNYKYNPTIKSVTGIVTDESGYPIPGVNVIETGTSNGTQSDFDGNYYLSIRGGRELAYSYVGYETLNYPIYATTMNVKMIPDGNALQEVVVTGHGIKKENKALGYSATSIESLLAGKVSGVNVSNQNGLTGAANTIKIRGTNSFSSNNDALYVIDGVPYSRNNFSGVYGNLDSARDFDLDPDQIESVDILKGTAATTLYGTEGRNGVIVITTKGGKGIENASGNYKETGITNTQFEIKGFQNIKSNTEITVIEIDNFNLEANYNYYVAPELNENVFLTATATNWEKFDLLQGEGNVYFEDAYAGKTIINPQATTDSLVISLGIDPSIIVKRERLDNFKKSSFLGGYRIIENEYQIEIKNNKRTSIQLVVEDRIPVSQNKEIKVSDVVTSGSNYDTEKGIMKWEIQLLPNETTKKEFSYTLKYPKNKKITL
ncbi:MAG: mucoidy inhibitor MuiA family protein [Flavobacteriaceae bacterium]|nr:mucoidy inhibitor MuiA family protein [Flavobacteriaceae bacterium]